MRSFVCIEYTLGIICLRKAKHPTFFFANPIINKVYAISLLYGYIFFMRTGHSSGRNIAGTGIMNVYEIRQARSGCGADVERGRQTCGPGHIENFRVREISGDAVPV